MPMMARTTSSSTSVNALCPNRCGSADTPNAGARCDRPLRSSGSLPSPHSGGKGIRDGARRQGGPRSARRPAAVRVMENFHDPRIARWDPEPVDGVRRVTPCASGRLRGGGGARGVTRPAFRFMEREGLRQGAVRERFDEDPFPGFPLTPRRKHAKPAPGFTARGGSVNHCATWRADYGTGITRRNAYCGAAEMSSVVVTVAAPGISCATVCQFLAGANRSVLPRIL